VITLFAAVNLAFLPMPGESPTDRGIRHGSALLLAGVAVLWGLP